MSNPRAYFTRIGPDEFQPERWCMGAWNTEELHIAPVNGLLMHTYERWIVEHGDRGLVAASIRFEYIGVVDFTPCKVSWSVIRPGRAVELVEGVVEQRGRPVLRGRIWRLATADTTAVAAGAPEPLPAPDECPAFNAPAVWPGDYIRSLNIRSVTPGTPGEGQRWISSPIDHVVAGETSTDLTRWLLLVDTSNGVAVRESPDEWQFPNLDLSIHLTRQPQGTWLGVDVHVTFGGDGQGLTDVVLFDLDGYVGRAGLGLLLRPRSGGSAMATGSG